MNKILATVLALATANTLSAQTTCSTQVVGTGCGAQLDVTFTPVGASGNHDITVDVSGMNPAGLGLMAWGQTALNVPLFGCNVYTDFLWGLTVHPDANGNWSWGRAWPASAIGFFRIQVATLELDPMGSLVVELTDCVLAECVQ